MDKTLIDTNIYSQAMHGNNDVKRCLQQLTHIGILSISAANYWQALEQEITD